MLIVLIQIMVIFGLLAESGLDAFADVSGTKCNHEFLEDDKIGKRCQVGEYCHSKIDRCLKCDWAYKNKHYMEDDDLVVDNYDYESCLNVSSLGGIVSKSKVGGGGGGGRGDVR